VEYGIFGFLLTKALLSSRKIHLIWRSLGIALIVIFVTMALGAIDETYQHFTKRMPSIYDWFADVSGATTFMMLTMIISSKSKTRKKK